MRRLHGSDRVLVEEEVLVDRVGDFDTVWRGLERTESCDLRDFDREWTDDG